MNSFDNQLSALIAEWQGHGTPTESILRDLVYAIATLGPADQDVPSIVADVLRRAADEEAVPLS